MEPLLSGESWSTFRYWYETRAGGREISNHYAPSTRTSSPRTGTSVWSASVTSALSRLGDYAAGPSHVLPTDGTAAWASPRSVNDFITAHNYMHFTQESPRRPRPPCRTACPSRWARKPRRKRGGAAERTDGGRDGTDRQKRERVGETSAGASLNLDGEGTADVSTGVGFFDHVPSPASPPLRHGPRRRSQRRQQGG